MKKLLGLVILGCILTSSLALAEPSVLIVFPQTNYQTSAEKIFFLGTAPPDGQVSIDGKPINRSKAGHFSPSLPLQLGENLFTVRYRNQELQIKVTRVATLPELPQGLAFAKDSLTPAADIARLPEELICFSAIAPPNASVSVYLANQTVALLPQPQQAQLPNNLAALTGQNQPHGQSSVGSYKGCTTVATPGDLGQPQFQLTLNGKTITQPGNGKIQILSKTELPVAQVTVDAGVARTGPSTDYSRLTPLPKGTRATVTGKEGEWLRLDYGAWINSQETRTLPGAVPPQTIIRSVGYRQLPGVTEMVFPLQVPVPVSVQQSDRTFSLTLYNTTAQTDIIRLDDDPLISRLDWQQETLERVKYTFNLKKAQQWGYKLRYDGTTLVLALRHPPKIGNTKRKPLANLKILLDPGHGGKESGASGPTGYLEKDVNLVVSKLLRDELVKRGATVVMTREDDKEVSLVERQAIISQEEPAIAISIHHNSLPDNGDAEKTKGFGSFWYHPQAHSLAIFLQNYVVKNLGRPDYGVFWNNLALTRPAAAPSVLLELGFMSNPDEFEQVVNPEEQKKMAKAIAQGITEWFKSVK
ncbi:N-acetylmuramoyl-L-alanine amidase [Nostoc linckia z18]|uniref:N-acetylmuramoyl-L-alanine amidase n=2 Tax=Nostoc linckia TaxID=92942 RepID=A0A9Q5Z650_NOSLI|nr:N-acetylmuramoyl-L-alanine amidase [Nostoc linckia]PHK29696.1 N-acetylmuramoyl-L-alanine amidase [Nostoc linckia z15]PHK42858.1 N-acetylmuramoyl-L-alanine amidase [Nostoc linckia z16]PHJ63260.1 N-acetylmuramoyl-L-alanine amidase [Nostoc linckia z1]PHJ64417.1 N-acetylmuramoyl-L-alanine amidase [Nostoc linckia z3]PHJ73890.1 N-acetylmuramoyl-L-alanine amidase [Nostoc linckia z2]